MKSVFVKYARYNTQHISTLWALINWMRGRQPLAAACIADCKTKCEKCISCCCVFFFKVNIIFSKCTLKSPPASPTTKFGRLFFQLERKNEFRSNKNVFFELICTRQAPRLTSDQKSPGCGLGSQGNLTMCRLSSTTPGTPN